MNTHDVPDPRSSVLAHFSSELLQLRTRERLSQPELARMVGVVQTVLGEIETAKRIPDLPFAVRLDELFATHGHFQRLWPRVVKYAYPAWFRPFVEKEASAGLIRTFQAQFVPGLLQTEDYARSVLSSGPLGAVEDLVTARLARQRVLARKNPPVLLSVLDESVLRREIGGRAVMRSQLGRLLDASATPGTVIQVIPYASGAHAGYGSFTVLSSVHGDDTGYEDGCFRGRILVEPDELQAAVETHELLRRTALAPDASRDLIRTVMKEL